MNKDYHYYDEGNMYPYADLEWVGKGWYAAWVDGQSCHIRQVGEDKYSYPDLQPGYGTASWADSPREAAGSYGHES